MPKGLHKKYDGLLEVSRLMPKGKSRQKAGLISVNRERPWVFVARLKSKTRRLDATTRKARDPELQARMSAFVLDQVSQAARQHERILARSRELARSKVYR